MSKAQSRPTFDTQTVLEQAASMDVKDLEDFVQELNRMIFQKKSVNKEFRQRELMQLINQTVLPREKRALYLRLVKKLESDMLTESEHRQFIQLSEEEEALRNERVKLLIELAFLKNVSLNQLLQDMGLQPVGHG